MFVYFIQAGNAVKIGKAIDPDRRVAELQTGSAFTLRVIARFACRSSKHALHLESLLHKHSNPWRLRGEWFERRRTISLLQSIEKQGGIEKWLSLGSEADKGPVLEMRDAVRSERRAREAIARSGSLHLVDLDAEYKAIMGR